MNFATIFAGLGALAVGLGAFGAHALKSKLSDYQLDIWEKAVFYQFIHILLAFAVIALAKSHQTLTLWSILIGIVLFSGSLFLLSLKDVLNLGGFAKVLGPITPIGGLAFIVAWVLFAISLAQNKSV